MLVEITTPKEFFEKHTADGPAIQVDESGEFLFADGAVCDALGDIQREPSGNTHERLTDQLRYTDLRLASATLRFDQARQSMVEQAELCLRFDNPLPCPGDDDIAVLESMRAECEALLARHHEIMRALHRTDEARAHRERERREESRRAGVRRVLDKLMRMKAPVSLSDAPEPSDPLLEAEKLVRALSGNRPKAGAITEE